MSSFFLVDGNSFYCSCERAFDPRLRDKPVAVLSNNDGCVISRTAEAKALGIAMGEPWHLARQRRELAGVRWFSSNYALYADMSRRMFEVMSSFTPDVEPYSIDEMFLGFDEAPQKRPDIARAVRDSVLRIAKIPTCVGIGPTKTIAKLANRHAKNTPDLGGICDLSEPSARLSLFDRWPVADVWGIGPRTAGKLARHGVSTVSEFLGMPRALVRRELSVVGARIQEELRGNSCMPLSLSPPTRKGLAVTRSFGSALSDLEAVEQAVASFACKAAERLRRLGLVAEHVGVFLRTSDFRAAPQHFGQASSRIERTSDSLALAGTAVRLARQVWRPGFDYAKGGVMLGDLAQAEEMADLLPSRDPVKSANLMRALDTLAANHGRDIVRPASCGTKNRWLPRQGHLSRRYTTDTGGLMTALA